MAAALKFHDSQTFGLGWKAKYVRVQRPSGLISDYAGRKTTLPKGAIGYVSGATPGSILVVFGADLMTPPPPTDSTYTVTHRRYAFVFTFVFADWHRLGLEVSL